MSDKSSYSLHGEIHPYLQNSTRNRTEIDRQGDQGHPWDQLPNETTTAYSAFLLYLDLGPHNRSQSRLAKIIYGNEKSTGQISKWSVENDWMNRAEAWDRYCTENRRTKMEKSVKQSEDLMISYLPKVTLNLCQAASGEKSLGRAEMRSITDFLDRIGPAKQRRSEPTSITNNVTINAPDLPGGVIDDTDNIPEAEVIEEEALNLIPQNLRNKRKG